MTVQPLPSLEQLIRSKIQRRILAAMWILISGAIVITVIETALSYSDLVTRLDRRANTLQDLLISEILVHNKNATDHILSDANKEFPDEHVQWIDPEISAASNSEGLNWKLNGSWSFKRPLKQLGGQNFGTFVFSGNFFISGGLLNALSHRLAFAFAICALMAFLLLPIASTAPKDLILGPVNHLMSLLREQDTSQFAANPAFSEIKSIQDEFSVLMEDRKKLDSQKLETAQLKTVTQTAQMLAHDIRRPFSLLKATLDGLSHTHTPQDIQELVTATVPGIRKSLDHLEGIIAELSNVHSEGQIPKERFSITDAIINGLAIAAPSVSQSSRINTKIQSNSIIFGVKNQIERIIANIVSNAFQAMGHNDYLNIECHTKEDSTVAISISNSGSYILPEDIESIFLPFFTKGKPKGTGLGLAISRKLALDHGGTLIVNSSHNNGTTFSLTLPILEFV